MEDNYQQRAFVMDDAVMLRYKKSLRRRNIKGGQTAPKTPGEKRAPGKRRAISAVRDCNTCQLFTSAKTPKMEPFGQGKMRIAVVGESPGRDEDIQGRPFVGKSGQLLKDYLDRLGVDLDRDCFLTNAFQCRPPDDKKPAQMKIWADCCRERLEKQLTEYKPQLIIALGADAMRSVLRPSFDTPTAFRYRGLAIPSVKYGCWVGCCLHPSYVMRGKDNELAAKRKMFDDDLAMSLEFLDTPLPATLVESEYTVLASVEDVKWFFDGLKKSPVHTAFDFETNALLPYGKGAKVYCASFADTPDHGYFLPLQFKNFWTGDQLLDVMESMAGWLGSAAPKVVQNLSMEGRWTKAMFHTWLENVINDTMVTHHVIYNRPETSGLDFQAFMTTGHDYKGMVDKEQDDWGEKEPQEKVQTYSVLDSRYTIYRHNEQQKILRANPGLKNASEFFVRCYPSLVRMESRGIRTDTPLLETLRVRSEEQQAKCVAYFDTNEFVEAFRTETGRHDWGPGSDKDFIDMFYKTLKVEPPPWKTKGGALPADKDAVQFIVDSVQDEKLSEFCQKMMLWRQLDTLLSTFIGGFQRLRQDDGLIHPSFMLHTVASYRSSSADPNFQNLPKREEAHAEFRKVVIPHEGDDFISEVDASGSEVRVIAMLSKDPVLIKQVKEGFDPHAYWAGKLFEIAADKVTKKQRFLGKNKMVFPLFYGSYYGAVAKDCKVSERHAKAIEGEFWTMYKGVKKWQEYMLKFYDRHGYTEFPTGFRRYRPLSKNQILNTTVQGTSFHMLLQSIADSDLEIQEKDMKSSLIIEVHDSAVASGREEERYDLHKILVRNMCKKQWDWQGDVPRGAELLSGPNWGEQKGLPVEALM